VGEGQKGRTIRGKGNRKEIRAGRCQGMKEVQWRAPSFQSLEEGDFSNERHVTAFPLERGRPSCKHKVKNHRCSPREDDGEKEYWGPN